MSHLICEGVTQQLAEVVVLQCLGGTVVWTTANTCMEDLPRITLMLYCTNVSWCLSEKEVNALLDELLKDVSRL